MDERKLKSINQSFFLLITRRVDHNKSVSALLIACVSTLKPVQRVAWPQNSTYLWCSIKQCFAGCRCNATFARYSPVRRAKPFTILFFFTLLSRDACLGGVLPLTSSKQCPIRPTGPRSLHSPGLPLFLSHHFSLWKTRAVTCPRAMTLWALFAASFRCPRSTGGTLVALCVRESGAVANGPWD